MIEQSILRMREVIRILSISRSTFYLLVKSGTFAKPINLGNRSVGWLASDVEEFIASRVKISRSNGAGL